MRKLILIVIMVGGTEHVSANMCSTNDIYGNHVYVECERREYDSASTDNNIPRSIQGTARYTHMPLDAMRHRQMEIRQRDMQMHANRHRLALEGRRTTPRPLHVPHLRQMQSQQNNLEMQIDNQHLKYKRRGYMPMPLDAMRHRQILNQQHEIELQIKQLQVEKDRLELERQRLEIEREWQRIQAARQQPPKENGYPRLIIR